MKKIISLAAALLMAGCSRYQYHESSQLLVDKWTGKTWIAKHSDKYGTSTSQPYWVELGNTPVTKFDVKP